MLKRLRVRPAAETTTVACHAPFTSMYLDQRGQVRACCQNDFHLLGNVTEASLLDIWRGPRTAELRRAMERQDLDLGCDFCDWQVAKGRSDLAFARWFDQWPVEAPDPDWPQQLELSLSNTCNLQCVMCDGEWSSSIRSQREGLPPLPKVYDDAFFEGLRPFLPHLERVKFLGGEPFLAAETLRVMEMLVEEGLEIECHVTTNGTQWSPRVERILDMLPVAVSLSIDAATPETYEAIRVGSSWDTVQRNLDRFQERAERKGTYLGLTYCLMTVNWHEFDAFCRMADERGLEAAVNTVRHPHHLSLYMLDADELATVVEGLERTERDRGGDLGGSRTAWSHELDRLREQLADRRAGDTVKSVDTWRPNPQMVRPFNHHPDPDPDPGTLAADPHPVWVRRQSSQDLDALREEAVGADAGRLHLDGDGVVIGVDSDAILGVPAADLVGRHGLDLPDLLGARLGGLGPVRTDFDEDGTQVLHLALAGGGDVAVFVTPADTGTWVYLAERRGTP